MFPILIIYLRICCNLTTVVKSREIKQARVQYSEKVEKLMGMVQ